MNFTVRNLLVEIGLSGCEADRICAALGEPLVYEPRRETKRTDIVSILMPLTHEQRVAMLGARVAKMKAEAGVREEQWRREFEANEKARKRAWSKYLSRIGRDTDEIAIMLAGVLRDPSEADESWFVSAVAAVRTNIEMNGRIAQEAEETGWTYELIRAAMRCQHRHENTNYDDLLARGYSKEDAREKMEEE